MNPIFYPLLALFVIHAFVLAWAMRNASRTNRKIQQRKEP